MLSNSVASISQTVQSILHLGIIIGFHNFYFRPCLWFYQWSYKTVSIPELFCRAACLGLNDSMNSSDYALEVKKVNNYNKVSVYFYGDIFNVWIFKRTLSGHLPRYFKRPYFFGVNSFVTIKSFSFRFDNFGRSLLLQRHRKWKRREPWRRCSLDNLIYNL